MSTIRRSFPPDWSFAVDLVEKADEFLVPIAVIRLLPGSPMIRSFDAIL